MHIGSEQCSVWFSIITNEFPDYLEVSLITNTNLEYQYYSKLTPEWGVLIDNNTAQCPDGVLTSLLILNNDS